MQLPDATSMGVVAAFALAAAILTFFSGFGLGTLLLPAFLIALPRSSPAHLAVAAVAVVHLVHSVTRVVLMGKHADRKVLSSFLPAAIIGSALGSALMMLMHTGEPIKAYSIAGLRCEITLVKVVLGAIICGFAFLELLPSFRNWSIERSAVPLGGFISGLFGGISGHQGVFRAAVLGKCRLSKESFLGTGSVCALAVDVVRISVYAGVIAFMMRLKLDDRFDELRDLSLLTKNGLPVLVAIGSACAIAGALIGQKLIKKVTLRELRFLLGVCLIAFGFMLMLGVAK